MGLPGSISSIALYGSKNKLQLPFRSLVEEFMVSQAEEVMLCRESTNILASSVGVDLRTGRNWRTYEAVDKAKARLWHSVLVETVTTWTCRALL